MTSAGPASTQNAIVGESSESVAAAQAVSIQRRFASDRAVEVCDFVFQAEDGIRDLTVTGVQTCALPICPGCAPPGPGDLVANDLFPASIGRADEQLEVVEGLGEVFAWRARIDVRVLHAGDADRAVVSNEPDDEVA